MKTRRSAVAGQRRARLSALFGSLLLVLVAQSAFGAHRPNILVIMADDVGYGDLGVHGNPKIKTPNIDRFAGESVRLKNFYVSPVCSPTRASLLTGRYNFRTGVVDTYLGRSLMHPDEVTLAEMLGASGYRTGIFGKWHLGDNPPLRPIDQGFQEALVIKGGGLGQPSDPPGGGSYFDPILQHNGKAEHSKGYCSDIFTQAAIDFFTAPGDRPFFAYLAFNCAHEPLEAPPNELAEYQKMNLSLSEFPRLGKPIPPEFAPSVDSVARVYAMITNIDTNVGKALKALDARGLARETIVVFLTDNGPAKFRFNAGLRGAKATVYDGGIHVPCYLRWPGQFPAGLVVDRIAAHIDLVPTVLDASGIRPPEGILLDGKSLLPLLRGTQTAGWRDRTLFFQWHRGDEPELGRAFAARSQTHKLVRPEPLPGVRKVPPLELYDMERDPLELENIAARHPDMVSKLYAEYQTWFRDVSSTRGFGPVRFELGGDRQNPTFLTRQDWRGPRAGWEDNDLGYWEVTIPRACRFDITLHVRPRRFPTKALVSWAGWSAEQALKPGQTECSFRAVDLAGGTGRFQAVVKGNGATAGVIDATVERLSK
jgi:arylsulfatase A-like enzyme